MCQQPLPPLAAAASVAPSAPRVAKLIGASSMLGGPSISIHDQNGRCPVEERVKCWQQELTGDHVDTILDMVQRSRINQCGRDVALRDRTGESSPW